MDECAGCGGLLTVIYYINSNDGRLYCSSECYYKAGPKVATLPPQPGLTDDECQCPQCLGEDFEEQQQIPTTVRLFRVDHWSGDYCKHRVCSHWSSNVSFSFSVHVYESLWRLKCQIDADGVTGV